MEKEKSLSESLVELFFVVVVFFPLMFIKASIIIKIYNMFILESTEFVLTKSVVLGVLFIKALFNKSVKYENPIIVVIMEVIGWFIIFGLATLTHSFMF